MDNIACVIIETRIFFLYFENIFF